MKIYYNNFIQLTTVCFILMADSFAQEYKKIAGTFYNSSEETVQCGCSRQGLLSYITDNCLLQLLHQWVLI